MAAVAERAYVLAQKVLEESKQQGTEVPTVSEDCDLDELLAWGRAVAKRGCITPERSRELLAMVRQALNDKVGR